MKLGYEVVGVKEVWHWPEEQRSSELLSKFALEQYLGKEYASGFPSHVKTQEEKEAYAASVSEALNGIEVDPDLFEYNPGLRATEKFKNNNFCTLPSSIFFYFITSIFLILRGLLWEARRQHHNRLPEEASRSIRTAGAGAEEGD